MRPLVLVSLGAEVIRIRREKFWELIDSEVKEKLYRFQIKYPRSVLEMCIHPIRLNKQVFAYYFSKSKKKVLISSAEKGGMRPVVVSTP